MGWGRIAALVSSGLLLAGCGGDDVAPVDSSVTDTGESPDSGPSAPLAPEMLVAQGGNALVVLTWTVPTDGESPDDFRIHRGTSADVPLDVSPLTTVPNDTTLINREMSYIDRTVDNGTTYHYRIVAQSAVGDSEPSNESSATPATTLVNPTQVSAGACNCILHEGGLICWGFGSCREDVPSLTDPTHVSASSFTCAVHAGGVACWGSSNAYGQLDVPTLTNPTQVSTAVLHACAIEASGVVCWGLDDLRRTSPPRLINPSQLSSGTDYTCAVHDGGIACWGHDSSGATTVPSLSNPTQLGAGAHHACALDDSGVVCWGLDDDGQTVVPSLSNPRQVTAGVGHSCALDDTGIVCWGANEQGQTSVPGLTNPSQVSAGNYHTCAIHDGGVTCWGGVTLDVVLVP